MNKQTLRTAAGIIVKSHSAFFHISYDEVVSSLANYYSYHGPATVFDYQDFFESECLQHFQEITGRSISDIREFGPETFIVSNNKKAANDANYHSNEPLQLPLFSGKSQVR